jgi:hypothetical protein
VLAIASFKYRTIHALRGGILSYHFLDQSILNGEIEHGKGAGQKLGKIVAHVSEQESFRNSSLISPLSFSVLKKSNFCYFSALHAETRRSKAQEDPRFFGAMSMDSAASNLSELARSGAIRLRKHGHELPRSGGFECRTLRRP